MRPRRAAPLLVPSLVFSPRRLAWAAHVGCLPYKLYRLFLTPNSFGVTIFILGFRLFFIPLQINFTYIIRHPFLYTLFSSRFTLIINNNSPHGVFSLRWWRAGLAWLLVTEGILHKRTHTELCELRVYGDKESRTWSFFYCYTRACLPCDEWRASGEEWNFQMTNVGDKRGWRVY